MTVHPKFSLEETELGTFDIVQLVPSVMGTFTDQAIATKFMAFLEGDATALPETPATASRTVAEAPAVEVQKTTPKAQETTVQKTCANQPRSASNEWTQEELNLAFSKLANGEKLRPVADEFGKSWTALRSLWARNQRASKAKTSTSLVPVSSETHTPAQKVTTAIDHLKGQVPCSNCERYFTPTPSSLDNCSRCSAG